MQANELIEEIVGLNLLEASKMVRESGFKFRVTKSDGNYLSATRDYNNKRINVSVEANEVTDANVG